MLWLISVYKPIVKHMCAEVLTFLCRTVQALSGYTVDSIFRLWFSWNAQRGLFLFILPHAFRQTLELSLFNEGSSSFTFSPESFKGEGSRQVLPGTVSLVWSSEAQPLVPLTRSLTLWVWSVWGEVTAVILIPILNIWTFIQGTLGTRKCAPLFMCFSHILAELLGEVLPWC